LASVDFNYICIHFVHLSSAGSQHVQRNNHNRVHQRG
jgi:hypothetical protein